MVRVMPPSKVEKLPEGEVIGYLEVIEGVVAVDVPDEVDKVVAGQHVPSKPGAVCQNTGDE